MRLRFITSTPMNVFAGSGTFVGITQLAEAVRALGVSVDFATPKLKFPIYTLQRVLFNQALRFKESGPRDITVGFDMDGYTVAKEGQGRHVASIKGVIADEMRFESGLTSSTMRWQARCERLHVHRADLVITTSRYAAQRIQELYGLTTVPSIVPELIDLAAWQRLLNGNPAPPTPGKFVVLSVCRFYPRKRLHVLLGATERLRSRISRLQVRIVGGGPESARLHLLCREKGLQSTVIWRENITQSELIREYNECDVFCLPSVQEGFGLVFLEAMAAAKAIVAARSGAAPEVVPHALLVEPDNEEALAEGIFRLYQDASLCQSLASQGLELVKRFDAPEVARVFLKTIAPLASPAHV